MTHVGKPSSVLGASTFAHTWLTAQTLLFRRNVVSIVIVKGFEVLNGHASCRFEHVFVGESKHGEISGLHNWVQFYNLEQKRELDYRGYIFPKRMYARFFLLMHCRFMPLC